MLQNLSDWQYYDIINKQKRRPDGAILASGGHLVDWRLQEPDGSVAGARNHAVSLGRNVVINGDFATDTVWNKEDPEWTISGGKANCDGTQAGVVAISQGLIIAVARDYQITYTVSNRTAGSITVIVGGVAGTARSTNDTFVEQITGTTGTTLRFNASIGFDGSIDIVIAQQTNIAASSSFPGAELLDNGDFADWTGDDPDGFLVVNESIPNREISQVGSGEGQGGTGTGSCNLFSDSGTIVQIRDQNTLTIGKRYKIITVVSSFDAGGVLQITSGVADYQTISSIGIFENEITANGVDVRLQTSNNTGTGYTVDSISVREANPLNGDHSGVTVGVDGNGGGILRAARYDGATTYTGIHSAELNSIFDPDVGAMVLWGKADSSIWTDGLDHILCILRADGGNFIDLFKSFVDDTIQANYRGGDGTPNSITSTVLGGSTDWFMLAFNWDRLINDKIELFINAVSVGTSSTLTAWVGNLEPDNTIIGAFSTSPGLVWNEDIAYVALYAGVTLSQAEITAQYLKGV
jgi:hypothetical protein